MIKINDYATKNHLKELPESEVYRLDLQDFSIIFALPKFDKPIKLFIPTPTKHIIAFSLNAIFAGMYHNLNHGIQIFFIDVNNVSTLGQYKNITPDWSKYIAKDNAVLFLSEEDYSKYKDIYPENYPSEGKMFNKNQKFFIKNDKIPHLIKRVPSPICEWGDYTKVSIILTSIHSQNIKEISNIAKDLKENYGVEYIEVIATHCYLKENKFVKYDYTGGYKGKASFRYNDIDKIITTDSTGVLEVQDTDKLKVIDCEEFFNNFLQNDKS